MEEELCTRCHDEPPQPGKKVCLDCECSEITNVEMALKAKELAQATMEKYPVLPQTTDMGVDV